MQTHMFQKLKLNRRSVSAIKQMVLLIFFRGNGPIRAIADHAETATSRLRKGIGPAFEEIKSSIKTSVFSAISITSKNIANSLEQNSFNKVHER